MDKDNVDVISIESIDTDTIDTIRTNMIIPEDTHTASQSAINIINIMNVSNICPISPSTSGNTCNSIASISTNDTTPLVTQDLMCNICLDLVEDAMISQCCLHIFCRDCIEKAININGACPCCRHVVASSRDIDVEIDYDDSIDAGCALNGRAEDITATTTISNESDATEALAISIADKHRSDGLTNPMIVSSSYYEYKSSQHVRSCPYLINGCTYRGNRDCINIHLQDDCTYIPRSELRAMMKIREEKYQCLYQEYVKQKVCRDMESNIIKNERDMMMRILLAYTHKLALFNNQMTFPLNTSPDNVLRIPLRVLKEQDKEIECGYDIRLIDWKDKETLKYRIAAASMDSANDSLLFTIALRLSCSRFVGKDQWSLMLELSLNDKLLSLPKCYSQVKLSLLGDKSDNKYDLYFKIDVDPVLKSFTIGCCAKGYAYSKTISQVATPTNIKFDPIVIEMSKYLYHNKLAVLISP